LFNEKGKDPRFRIKLGERSERVEGGPNLLFRKRGGGFRVDVWKGVGGTVEVMGVLDLSLFRVKGEGHGAEAANGPVGKVGRSGSRVVLGMGGLFGLGCGRVLPWGGTQAKVK